MMELDYRNMHVHIEMCVYVCVFVCGWVPMYNYVFVFKIMSLNIITNNYNL